MICLAAAMPDIYQFLDQHQISYQQHDHPAVFTVAESQKYDFNVPGAKTKNLFLRNKKGSQHFLVVVQADKRVDLKALAKQLEVAGGLGFASEQRLFKYLGLTPGSVSPFGLINDTDHHVQVIIDQDLMLDDQIGFHPNVNTATLVISTEDFKKYLDVLENLVKTVAL